MSDSDCHFQISQYIQAIIALCKEDQSKINLAISNFRSLLDVLELYDKSPDFYNNLYNESKAHSPKLLKSQENFNKKMQNFSKDDNLILRMIENTLEKKMNFKDLKDLADFLSSKTGIELKREEKTKPDLLC